LELSLWDQQSLWREPRWNADRRARLCRARAAPAGAAVIMRLLAFRFPFLLTLTRRSSKPDRDGAGHHRQRHLTKIGVGSKTLRGFSLLAGRQLGCGCIARTGGLAPFHLSPWERGRANHSAFTRVPSARAMVSEGEGDRMVQNCKGRAPSPQPSPPRGEGARCARLTFFIFLLSRGE
jgi:hypothetical protein